MVRFGCKSWHTYWLCEPESLNSEFWTPPWRVMNNMGSNNCEIYMKVLVESLAQNWQWTSEIMNLGSSLTSTKQLHTCNWHAENVLILAPEEEKIKPIMCLIRMLFGLPGRSYLHTWVNFSYPQNARFCLEFWERFYWNIQNFWALLLSAWITLKLIFHRQYLTDRCASENSPWVSFLASQVTSLLLFMQVSIYSPLGLYNPLVQLKISILIF